MELIKSEKNLGLDSELLVNAVVGLMKQNIFNEFIKTRELSDVNQEFCEKIDWHPVDELPMKESFIKELQRVKKEPHTGPIRTPEEFNEWCNSL